jgi:NAD-dependent dihydropyrimidine dehydrogenase PreA subunit
MGIKEELQVLTTRAQAIGARLDLLSRRIIELQQEPETTRNIAVIDQEMCLGCGRCVDACPQGAIVLRPYQTAGTLVSRRNVAKS